MTIEIIISTILVILLFVSSVNYIRTIIKQKKENTKLVDEEHIVGMIAAWVIVSIVIYNVYF
jgi:hypothetical protein